MKSYQETAFIDRKHFSQRGSIFLLPYHKLHWNSTIHTNGCTKSLVKNSKHTTTMVSRLPLWQHGFGKLAHPAPGSHFRRVCPRVGLKGLTFFYCVAKKKIFTKLNDLFYFYLPPHPLLTPPKQWYRASPHASQPAHILSIIPFVADACFWLVVV